MDSEPKKSVFTKCRTDIKIVVVGSSGTGKTSFCSRWTKNSFDKNYRATVMSDFSYKIYKYKEDYYKIQIWDIAGQDKNIYTSRVFTKGAHGCIIFSDVTNSESLQNTLKWKKSVDDNTKFIDGDYLPCVLVQNKIDLINEEQLTNQDENIKVFIKNNKFTNSFKTSCLNGIGIDDVMNFLIKNIIERLEEYSKKTSIPIENENRTSIVIQNTSSNINNLSLYKGKLICC
jgi:small GTP-binding protein